MASTLPTVSLNQHTPFCGINCDLKHHNLVAALFMDGRKAISRIDPSDGLPLVLKQAIDSAILSDWDQNCFIPDPLKPLRCPLLFLACAFGKTAVVEGLLRNNFSPRVLNEYGETALHFAVKTFHLNKTAGQHGRQGRKEAFEKVVNILTDCDPKIMCVKDKNGYTAFHTSASYAVTSHSKKIDFYQFCAKHLIKRLVELEGSSVFTRKEVMDIIKAPESRNGNSVLHILARNCAYFEVLKFAGDLVFRGKLPEDQNSQGKSILSIAWESHPREAVKIFTTLQSNTYEQEPERSAENTEWEEDGNNNQMSTDNVADNPEDAAREKPSYELSAPEFDSEDDAHSDDCRPYIDQVFSLSCGECALHGEGCSCSKNSEDAIKNFTMSGEDFVASGKNSDYCQNPEDAITRRNVEIKESNMEAVSTSTNEHSDKVSAADNSFLEFVTTEGLGLHAQAKKNIVGVVMAEYSNKLSKVEERLPKLVQLMKEEEMALMEKKEREIALEEELALLKKEILTKQNHLEELRRHNDILSEEKKALKRKVSHCEEIQKQLENDCVKKLRLE